MKWTMKTPCDTCPFRRGEGAVRLTPGRAREIAEMMVHPQGGTFPCHKSVDYDKVDEVSEFHRDTGNEVRCAGALIFAEVQGCATQMMRITERFGGYDHTKLAGHDEVFHSVREMVAAQKPKKPSKRKAKK